MVRTRLGSVHTVAHSSGQSPPHTHAQAWKGSWFHGKRGASRWSSPSWAPGTAGACGQEPRAALPRQVPSRDGSFVSRETFLRELWKLRRPTSAAPLRRLPWRSALGQCAVTPPCAHLPAEHDCPAPGRRVGSVVPRGTPYGGLRTAPCRSEPCSRPRYQCKIFSPLPRPRRSVVTAWPRAAVMEPAFHGKQRDSSPPAVPMSAL